MSERLRDRLDQLEEAPCTEALAWVGDKSIAEAWETCPRGDWMLWYLELRGVDCATAGFWCAERARQHALRALPPSPQRDALAACAPITDRDTAAEAEAAARAANRAAWAKVEDTAARAAAWGAWVAAAAAARAANRAAARAAGAVMAVEWSPARAEAVREAEQLAIADHVRAHYRP